MNAFKDMPATHLDDQDNVVFKPLIIHQIAELNVKPITSAWLPANAIHAFIAKTMCLDLTQKAILDLAHLGKISLSLLPTES